MLVVGLIVSIVILQHNMKRPTHSKLAEMREDVNETLDAINSMLESEETLASACLSDRGTQNRMWKFTYVGAVCWMCVFMPGSIPL